MFKGIKREGLQTKNFVPDIKNYNVISSEKADFVYNNCKEYLLNTLVNAKNLQNKVLLMLGFILYVVTFSFLQIIDIYTSSELGNGQIISNIHYLNKQISVFLLLVIVSYVVIGIILIMFAFYPQNQAVSGNEPREIIYQKFLKQDINIIKIGESITYQERIDRNSKANQGVAKIIRRSLVAMILFPALFSIIPFSPW
tara:strand:- start:53 stop:646 length:594 start_codon:yes stop_codon:yes gene_type:complete